MDTEHTGDDFDLLGRAVARVLRDAFAASAATRASAAEQASAFDDALAQARSQVAAVLAAATTEAENIRTQALDDARDIVLGADAEVLAARRLLAEERVRLDDGLKDLVRDVHRSVGTLERSVRSDHLELFERATAEAQMILRQARLHHRATAREVDRMIEAAAQEAADLRHSALADAARVAARVRGVVHIDGPAPEMAEAPQHGRLRPLAS